MSIGDMFAELEREHNRRTHQIDSIGTIVVFVFAIAILWALLR